jgi:hypothetical protein
VTRHLLAALLLTLIAAPRVAEAQPIRSETVRFAHGATGTTLRGSLSGSQTIDYVLGARAGQTLAVTLSASNPQAYFNVLPPGSDEAVFIGSTSGSHYEGRLQTDGDHRIRVYLMRSAARRGERADFRLRISITDGQAGQAAAPTARREARGTMPCSFGQPGFDRQCAWRVERRGPDAATIRIERPGMPPRVLVFQRGGNPPFTASGTAVRTQQDADTWTLKVGTREHYRFADALLTGG